MTKDLTPKMQSVNLLLEDYEDKREITAAKTKLEEDCDTDVLVGNAFDEADDIPAFVGLSIIEP